MKAQINPPTIADLCDAMDLPKNKKMNHGELTQRYFKVCQEAKDLYERWKITESDEVFREWQFKAKQAEQLKVTIGNRIAN